jgi:single-strand DNA-binding protein
MLNESKFIGNITKDIELRKTASGKFVTNLDIALNYFANGEKKTEFVQVVLWEETAENASKHLSKGRQVFVQAKVVVRKREIEGKNIPIPEFHAERVVYLGSSNQNGGGNQQQSNGYNDQQQQQGNQNQQHRGYQQQRYQQESNPFGSQGTDYDRNADPNFPFGR